MGMLCMIWWLFHLSSLQILTRAQRARVHFCPQHWLLCHLALYKLEFEFDWPFERGYHPLPCELGEWNGDMERGHDFLIWGF